MKEFDIACFFFNLKVVAAVVAATATTSINRIRVRDSSVVTKLIYHMPVGFHTSPTIMHTYTLKKVSKENFEKIYYINIPLCSFLISNLDLRNLKVSNF